MSAVLVDTNVLVYAAARNAEAKGRTARAILLTLGPRVILSAQVLAEYANVLTHPSKHAVPAERVALQVGRLSSSWRILPLNTAVVVTALHAMPRWQMPYYDAQIWAAAALNRIPVVLSEDFPSGATLGGVRFVNPFEPGFNVEAL